MAASRPFLDVDSPAPHVRRVSINNPAKKNAISRATMLDFAKIIREADKDDDVYVLLITSRIPGVFSSGADVSSGVTDPGEGFDELARAVYTFSKLLAVAVNGLAVGVAVTLIAHADLAWCTEGARFFTPFGRLALVPELASSLLFPARLGRPLATEVLLAGRPLTSAEALRCGLVAGVVADEAALEAAALACIARIIGQHAAKRSVITFKRLFRAPDADAVLRTHAEELRELRARFADGEPVEAVLRFFEERQAGRTESSAAVPRL